jgi:hypothetical protein
MNPFFLAGGALMFWTALRQARSAYGLNDADGWPFLKAEASKPAKLAYAAWLATVGVVAVIGGSFE